MYFSTERGHRIRRFFANEVLRHFGVVDDGVLPKTVALIVAEDVAYDGPVEDLGGKKYLICLINLLREMSDFLNKSVPDVRSRKAKEALELIFGIVPRLETVRDAKKQLEADVVRWTAVREQSNRKYSRWQS